MTNQTNAVQEAERNAAAESYFDARPSLDTVEARRIYEAGFDRAYALLSKLRAEGVPVAVTDHRGDVHWKNGRKPGITLYAAPVASAPADERAAFKKCHSAIIKALSSIARADGPDTRKADDPELLYRSPVMDDVVRIRIALDECSAALASAPVAGEAQPAMRVFVKDGKASHPTTLGDTLPDGFHDFYAAPQASPGCIVVQETDTVPHVHPDYGPGIFFTEDARIEPDAAPQTSAEDVRKVRADAFIAGFICAGGDAEEAKRQAPQFQACVDAGRKHQPQAAKDGGQQHPGDSNDREAWAADMLAAGAMHLGGDCWEWDVDDFEFRLWQVATRRTNRTAHAAIAKATPKDLP